ncbi:MAG: transcription-repair coupling factor [Chloroflexi bacterium]|nr:transcription-repair coupling factor [Chloroflexota bacterium]
MALEPLLQLLAESDELDEIRKGLQREDRDVAATVLDAATSCTIASLWRTLGRPMLVVTPAADMARRLTDQLPTWTGDDEHVYQFAELEILPYERLSPDSQAIHQRIQSLAALTLNRSDSPPLIITSVAAAAQKVLSANAFKESEHAITVGDRLSMDELVGRWVDMGYELKPVVDGPGLASRRGGILDVYPPSLESPVRIEFFGDEVESIREFDPESQRSTEPLDEVTVIPARDNLPALADRQRLDELIANLEFGRTDDDMGDRIIEELGRVQNGERIDGIELYSGFVNHGSIFDYLPDDTVVVSLRPTEGEENARIADGRMERQREAKEKRGEIPRNFPMAHLDWGLIADGVNSSKHLLRLSPWGVTEDLPGSSMRLPFLPAPVTGADPGRLWSAIADRSRAGVPTVILSRHGDRLVDLAGERGIDARSEKALDGPPQDGSVTIVPGHLRSGFLYAPNDVERLMVLTDSEVFGVTREQRPTRRRRARRAARLQDLQVGAYMVHIEHGIGRFAGTTEIEGETTREYMVLEYAEEDKLFVPMEQLDRLSPYHGSGDTPPRLTRLGTQEWTRAKARAKRATEQMAGELIALYAAREVAHGIATGPDTPWQDQLEASFPFEETPDQARALVEVKADMELSTPMDRLVSGDVGYGKTEVAIRAAFKSVQAGYQVAILVPTTILAQQHLATFRERMSGFPVTVVAMSRLVPDADMKKALSGLATGEVDIVIGTHRLLQKDIFFKNLGLVIIDEEHRFGVVHKERLKRMRSAVDVMTMSATPIPRTLYLSLAGIRDMSTIETPPEERLPIKTFITEDSTELVREAILRELDRGGQVFYVHNRVKTIDYFAGKLRKLVPEARIEIGHGQMDERELETVMTEFANHDFDVLICTTIIESGLDLPNVNTLLIDRSDRFGLSQLYQLRGRIGRSSRRAYAYFLIDRGRRLTEAAEQRLNTIALATELGAGYQIAMRDLEIRGAGNILGAEQSGQIAAIGFDLYTRLLSQAVRDLREAHAGSDGDGDEEVPGFSLVNIDLGVDARLPYTYVEDLAERLTIYQRIARITSEAVIDDMARELRDRFGPLPTPAELLLATVRARVLCEAAGVVSISSGPTRLTLNLKDATGGARGALQKALGRGVDVGHMQIRMEVDREDADWLEELFWTLEQIVEFREEALKLFELAGALAPAD